MANELTKAQQTAMALNSRPDFLEKGDTRGADHITSDDLRMPRLSLAQQMSPQVNPSEGSYIENLRVGEMFNDLTGQVMGKGPLRFAIVRADPPRFIEFIPREQGGGIRDMNVPPNDPRTQFGPNGEQPIATKFYDFVVALLDGDNIPSIDSLIAISMKKSAIKAAKKLNGLVRLRNAPVFAGTYTVNAVMLKNTKGTFAGFDFNNDGWVTKDQFAALTEIYEALKNKNIVIDREPGSDDADEFPTGGDAPQM
jgi:hypothetical protein